MRQPSANPDVVLTGIPRSGTTLACHLLNQLPNTVALHEPMPPAALSNPTDHARQTHEIAAFFHAQRLRLLTEHLASSKQRNGLVPANSFAAGMSTAGVRPALDVLGEVRIAKPLTPDFTLVIKQTTLFVALLPHLTPRFAVHALIRHPLAALASWNTVAAGLRTGRPGSAGAADPALMSRLRALDDDLDRQIALLHWFFVQLAHYLPSTNLIRYEAMVESGGRALQGIRPEAVLLDAPLVNQNANPLYARAQMERIGTRLLRTDGAYWRFYSRSSVDDILGHLH